MTPVTPDLKSVQSLLYRLIVAPSGVADGLRAESDLPPGGIDAVIRGDEHLSAIERLGIYAEMYFYRLLDCLKEDYPATLAVVGATNFHNLITGYLLAHPPSYPSVLYAGHHLADFLASHPLRDEWPFLADLARFERALIDVFHGPDAPAMNADQLRAVAPTDWPALELKIHPASELLALQWNVTKIVQAVEEGDDWQPPERGAASILVWRKNCRCYYREIDGIELVAIQALSRGATLAALCASIADAAPAEDPAALVFDFLERWRADGILMAPSPGPSR
ncbi:MAG: DNA-binding domain-containing protein [Candidatus Binataceae bacterium]|jgi:hypothetical protein